jgi:hypothetical protein
MQGFVKFYHFLFPILSRDIISSLVSFPRLGLGLLAVLSNSCLREYTGKPHALKANWEKL